MVHRLEEALRSVYLPYPIPFLATLLGLTGLALVALARFFQNGESWLILGLGNLMFLMMMAIVIKAVFVSPELLRVERLFFFESGEGGQ